MARSSAGQIDVHGEEFSQTRLAGEIKANCDLVAYLKGQGPRLWCGDRPLLWADNPYIVHNGLLYSLYLSSGDCESETLDYIRDVCPSGAITKSKAPGFKYTLVLNGDNGPVSPSGSSYLMKYIAPHAMPTISFACLANLYEDEGGDDEEKIVELGERLAAGTIQLMDFIPDEVRKFTKSEASRYKRAASYSAVQGECHAKIQEMVEQYPDKGFTPTSAGWHRSCTALFYDRPVDMTFIMGQDEGTYFACELPGRCFTVAKAMKTLIPPEVRGKTHKRQGEWFCVSVDEKKVPEMKDCAVQFHTDENMYSRDTVHLPLEDEDANHHYIHTNDGRIGRDGRVYALNPTLSHNQHTSVSMEGWVTFYRNTALRSVSEEGVD